MDRVRDSQRTSMGKEQRESSGDLTGINWQIQEAQLTPMVIKRGD